MTTYTPVGDGIALCLHPNQTHNVRQSASYRSAERQKVGPRRWRVRTHIVPSRPLLDVSCPDCPARAIYISELATTPMAAWLLKTEPEETTKPDWPECMCTPTGECGRCWEKRQLEAK